MKKHRQEYYGEWFIGIAAFFNAFAPIGLHFGAQALPPIQFLSLITLIGSVLFFFLSVQRKELKQLLNPAVQMQVFAYTLLLAVIPYGIITYATRFSSAINTTLFTQSEVIFAALLGTFILKEKISRLKLLAIGLILVANILVFFDGHLEVNLADLALFLAPVFFVFGNMIAKNLQKNGIGFAPILFFRSLVGGLLLLLFSLSFETWSPITPSLWIFLLVFGLLIFGLEKIFFQLGLHRMDVSKASALLMTSPALSFALAFILLGEIPTFYQWLGIILTVLALFFLLKTTSKQWVELELQED